MGPLIRQRNADRELDVVVFGAAGFTGTLVVNYLSGHLPREARWAIVGRTREELDTAAERLRRSAPKAAAPELLVADVTDPVEVGAIAPRSRVIVSTIGPYLERGGVLVALCAAHGTDYVDLCGEPEFVDRVFLEQNALAESTGARLVHACGFESVPADLGVFFAMKHVPEDVAIEVTAALSVDARFSRGTLDSAFGQFRRAREARDAADRRRHLEGAPLGRRVRYVRGLPHYDDALGRWLVPLPTMDPRVVVRSASALEQYGPDFSYSHYAAVDHFATVATGMAGVASVFAASQVPVVLRVLDSARDRFHRRRTERPGVHHHTGPTATARARAQRGAEGPDVLRRARSSFTLTLLAKGGGRTVVVRVAGGDPGYAETSMMIAEAAMCLAFDENPDVVGQQTPARAMGDALLARVRDAGLGVELLQE